MTDEVRRIAIAFPVDEEKRKALRHVVRMPMAVYAHSVVMPCAGCQEPLLVGPRTAAVVSQGEAHVYCPPCAALEFKRAGDDIAAVINLGNVAIRHDTDYD